MGFHWQGTPNTALTDWHAMSSVNGLDHREFDPLVKPQVHQQAKQGGSLRSKRFRKKTAKA